VKREINPLVTFHVSRSPGQFIVRTSLMTHRRSIYTLCIAIVLILGVGSRVVHSGISLIDKHLWAGF